MKTDSPATLLPGRDSSTNMIRPAQHTPRALKVATGQRLKRRTVKIKTAAGFAIGIIFFVEPPLGLFTVDYRPFQTADVVTVVNVELGEIVLMIAAELGVFLEQCLFDEPVNPEMFDRAVGMTLSHRIRPFEAFAEIVLEQYPVQIVVGRITHGFSLGQHIG